MAEKACHIFASTTRFGLIQALARTGEFDMTMDEKQADAIARAMLEPDAKAQEQLRQKRARDATALVVQRRAAGIALAAMAIGGAIGHFAFGEISRYLIMGGLVGFLIARLVQRRTA